MASGTTTETKSLTSEEEKEAMKAIENAIANNDLELLEQLLNNKTPEFCSEAFYLAVKMGIDDYNRIRKDREDGKIGGDDLFQEAAKIANVKNKGIVEFFLKHGANYNEPISEYFHSYTVFGYACREASLDIIKLMIDSGADMFGVDNGRTPVRLAFESGEENKINFFLNLANAENINKWHLLHLYNGHAENPQEDVMIRLLQIGADINKLDEKGHTVLNYSTKRGDVKTIEFLINQGADVNGKNNLRRLYYLWPDTLSELSFAVVYGNIEIVKMLLDKGANPNLSCNAPLIMASRGDNNNSLEVIELLLSYGADINKHCRCYDSTPLAVAALYSQEKIIKLLLDRGALKDNNALIEAVYYKRTKVVKLLLNLGFDANCNEQGAPLLFTVARNNNSGMLQILLDHGADINKEINGVTALKRSIGWKQWDSSKILVKQMILMMEQGLQIIEVDLKAANAVEILKVFKNECIRELRLLKAETFDDSCLSYFDIYEIKDVCKLAGLARNENIVRVIKSNDFQQKFPIYGGMIVEHFDQGILRNNDFELIKRFVNYLSTRDHDQLPKLPLTVISDMFSYLDFEDVANLRKL